MTNKKCVQLTVKGKVQGVFFRKFTKIKAEELKIKGFVKNELRGSVFIEACGDSQNIDKFIEWCHHGPANAKVEKVTAEETEIKEFSSFQINYF